VYRKGTVILRKRLNQTNESLNIRIVLDRSGSMVGCQKVTIDALNEYLRDLKQEKDISALITLSTFDSISIDVPIKDTPIKKLKFFPNEILQPRGGTPLFDAIGLAIHDLERRDESTDENKVLVIVTDGNENASKEYTFENISSKIKEKEDEGWLVIYLGAHHDAFQQSNALNFSNDRSMRYSKKDSVDTFKAVTRTTLDYSRGIKSKEIFFTEKERFAADKSEFRISDFREEE